MNKLMSGLIAGTIALTIAIPTVSAQDSNNGVKDLIDSLTVKVDGILSHLTNTDATIDGLKNDTQAMKDSVSNLKTENESLTQTIQTQKMEIETLKSQNEQFQNSMDSLTTEVNSLKQDVDILKNPSKPMGSLHVIVRAIYVYTSNSLDGGTVTLTDAHGDKYVGTTDANGNCTFNVPIETYNVTISKDGMTTRTKVYQLTGANTVEIDTYPSNQGWAPTSLN